MQIELIRLQIYSALQILVFIFCFHQLETELQFYGDDNSWNVHLLHSKSYYKHWITEINEY